MSAVLSPCGKYRYQLRRYWDTRPSMLFVMLNPSTADAETDDPTIRRCMGFARANGAGGIEVYNLFALRATKPKGVMLSAEAGVDPVGPENDAWLQGAIAGRCPVAAWGATPWARNRARDVLALARVSWRCLGWTKNGSPRHPLYVRGDQPLVTFRGELPEEAE